VGQVRRPVDRAHKGCSWLGHPCPMRAVLSVLVLGAALALCLVPVRAFAWQVSHGEGVVTLMRDSVDTTAAVTGIVYHGYKGGSVVTSTSVQPYSQTSYLYNKAQMNSTAQVMSFWAMSTPGPQMLYVSLSGPPYTTLFVVALQGGVDESVSVSGTVPVTVSNSPTVTLDTSVSIDGTLPVSVVSAGGFDESALQKLVALVVVLGGGGVGVAFAQRSRAA